MQTADGIKEKSDTLQTLRAVLASTRIAFFELEAHHFDSRSIQAPSRFCSHTMPIFLKASAQSLEKSRLHLY